MWTAELVDCGYSYKYFDCEIGPKSDDAFGANVSAICDNLMFQSIFRKLLSKLDVKFTKVLPKSIYFL